VAIVKATTPIPIDGAGAWRRRIAAAMTYYARRPGQDRDAAEADARTRGGPRVQGRWFVTQDGERIPLAEAEDRFLAGVARREAAWNAQQAARAATGRERRAARLDARIAAFLDRESGPDPDRREQIAARWRHQHAARERLPAPAFRVYRVILSTSWAVVDGRDVGHVLGTALGGAAAAAGASAVHATARSLRDLQRHGERLVEREAQRRQRETEREQRAEARRTRQQERQAARRRERADAQFADRWMAVRHAGPGHTHPHWHAVLLSDRALTTRDYARMRQALAERERQREREQHRDRPPEPARPPDRERGPAQDHDRGRGR
jgi:hypothetical protein